MRFKDIAALVTLVVTAYFSLATSYGRKNQSAPVNGNTYILSDCTIPATESVVTVSNGAIIAPGGVAFTDFGFPSAVVAEYMTGIVGGVVRECMLTYGEDGYNNVKNRWLFSCFDGGQFKCSIYTQPH